MTDLKYETYNGYSVAHYSNDFDEIKVLFFMLVYDFRYK